MFEYKESKWAYDIIRLQKEDGSWGYFHTLSNPSRQNPITTEQALRRLEILGCTIEDEPVSRAVSYMQDCLEGKKAIPDRREKVHDWDVFTALMLSAWIRRFTKDIYSANEVAHKWAEIISHAFAKGVYDSDMYVDAYKRVYRLPPKGARLLDFAVFYHVSLLADVLDDKTALPFMDYILHNKSGIYYIYGSELAKLPAEFKTKDASRYIAAVELLADYRNPGCREKLLFVADWLNNNREPEGYWDMGTAVKDGVYFPLSDSWRRKENRIKDCTYRISRLIKKIEGLQFTI